MSSDFYAEYKRTEIPQESKIPSQYLRDYKEDMKLALDYLFEFQDKINSLHPRCIHMIDSMFKSQNNF